MPPKTGIGVAMAYFGRKPNQRIAEFKAEWDTLTEKDKAEITAGLTDETLTYDN